jgi:hypothetical protein
LTIDGIYQHDHEGYLLEQIDCSRGTLGFVHFESHRCQLVVHVPSVTFGRRPKRVVSRLLKFRGSAQAQAHHMLYSAEK